ncbi:predicted protein [Histoplasma capsulatum G186AR]|uniref:Uncharacterized protein n=1 Tax=Ajellomyces capsulatus (strain G186AR / H82 / ATCC MYA-2454 / RMSCC 2432) TaxID=447093 RepID=C0NI83_AJECG|nr:uncharacterized protein HCBG_03055 [Histoplasma capsulatum G186AR]EEH09518.1 predicted protein [Histoplasma capsulatum G186AR]
MAGLRGNFALSTGNPNLADCLEFSNSNNPIENHRPVRICLVLRKQESQVQISPTLLSGNMGMRDMDGRVLLNMERLGRDSKKLWLQSLSTSPGISYLSRADY